MNNDQANRRSLIDYCVIGIKGLTMGAADVVPGVSGGTIAFITGIYEELINSLSKINIEALRVLKKQGLNSAWNFINGNFFVALFLGIFISVFSLAKVVTYLLDKYPVFLWSFFFGLVVASFILVVKTIKKWNVFTIISLIIGALIAGYISSLTATASGEDLWYIFVSGAIAICAMILPGISGAFILVLLGSYHSIMTGIKTLDLKIVLVFLTGCVVGLLSFSKLLNYLFAHFKQVVLSLLSGFLIGSLIKIWPWKNPVGAEPIVIHSDGREEFMMGNVAPNDFIGDAMVLNAILFALFGLILVLVIDKLGTKYKKEEHVN
jgi:putative membrane protein